MALMARASHVIQWSEQRAAKPRGGANPRKPIVVRESLVIADQHAAVNTFPGLVHTARHTMGVGFTRRRLPNLREGGDHGGFHDWGEVVTR